MQTQHALDELARLFEQHGHNHYGEAVNQTQHAVQSGRLAMAAGHDDDIVLGAFLHDIGHLLVNEVEPDRRDAAIYRHQHVGAAYLRDLGFAAVTCDMVERHVEGKRYLTAVKPGYADTLSAASVESLAFQGGPMKPHEVNEFDKDPNRDLFLELRVWDDKAKNAADPDTDITPFLAIAERRLQG